MVESCERSLKRLQLDTIDIYQFHGVEPHLYRDIVDRLYPTAERLQKQGKIRFIGVTEFFFRDAMHDMLVTAMEDDIWDTIMLKYGIMNMAAAKQVLPMAKERNVGVMNMSAVRVKMTRHLMNGLEPHEVDSLIHLLEKATVKLKEHVEVV